MNQEMSDILVKGILPPFITALVTWLLTHVIPKIRWKKTVHYLLLITWVVAWVIPVYFFALWLLWKKATSLDQIQISFYCFLAQAGIGFLIYGLLFRKRVRVEESHYGEACFIKTSGPIISVRKLSNDDLKHDDDILELNYTTFSQGIDFLLDQIKRFNPQIKPDLFVGINYAGLAMASIIAGRYHEGRKVLGSIRTNGDHTISKEHVALPRESVKSILVIDLEVKHGTSLKNVIEYLHQVYGNDIDIKMAVLVASRVKGKIGNLAELCANSKKTKGVFCLEEKYLPTFLAFTSWNRVKLPDGVG